MTFYILFYSAIGMLLVTDNLFKKNNIFFLIAAILVSLVSGLRDETGYDYFNYVYFFTTLETALTLEPLFWYSIELFRPFNVDYHFLFLAYSSATILFIVLSASQFARHRNTAVILYLLIPGLFLNTFTIVRQALAIAIFFYATLSLLYRHDRIKFVLFSVVAFLFHYSTILPTIIVWVFYRSMHHKLPVCWYVIVVSACFAISTFGITEMIVASIPYAQYAIYAEQAIDVSNAKVIAVNVFFVVVLYVMKASGKNSEDIVLFNLCFVGVIFLNLFSRFEYLTRISYFFLIFQILLVPSAIGRIKKNSLKLPLISIFSMFYLTILLRGLLFDLSIDIYPKLTPYKSILF